MEKSKRYSFESIDPSELTIDVALKGNIYVAFKLRDDVKKIKNEDHYVHTLPLNLAMNYCTNTERYEIIDVYSLVKNCEDDDEPVYTKDDLVNIGFEDAIEIIKDKPKSNIKRNDIDISSEYPMMSNHDGTIWFVPKRKSHSRIEFNDKNKAESYRRALKRKLSESDEFSLYDFCVLMGLVIPIGNEEAYKKLVWDSKDLFERYDSWDVINYKVSKTYKKYSYGFEIPIGMLKKKEVNND